MLSLRPDTRLHLITSRWHIIALLATLPLDDVIDLETCNVLIRAQHESICRSPVLKPVSLVNMQGRHLDPNRFKHRITWLADDYLQVTCMHLHMPKAP